MEVDLALVGSARGSRVVLVDLEFVVSGRGSRLDLVLAMSERGSREVLVDLVLKWSLVPLPLLAMFS